jgi:hypothetical protein
MLEFLFVVAVPLVVVAVVLGKLFLIGFVFDALENPEAVSRAIEGMFRRPPRPARTAGPEHYYRPYWLSR